MSFTRWDELGLEHGKYFVVTLHRPANVDSSRQLAAMLAAIGNGSRDMPVVFPVHPRTAKTLRALRDVPDNFKLVDPQAYLEFNCLVMHCKAVITDSGGITEDATVMGKPCMTLRDTAERLETVTVGTNELVGSDPARLHAAMTRLFGGDWKKGGIPEQWDGQAGSRIVSVLERPFARSVS